METITAKTPWENQMDQIPMHLEYFEGSMVDKVMQIAEQYPNNIAFDFMGKSTTYRELMKNIERCAQSLKTIGVPGNGATYAHSNGSKGAGEYDISPADPEQLPQGTKTLKRG